MANPETSTVPLVTDDETHVIRIAVLSGVNAEVKIGQVVCEIGPSGSGKSHSCAA